MSVTAILGFIAVLPRCYPGSGKVVGATGFEPATPCAQGRCANQAALRPDTKSSENFTPLVKREPLTVARLVAKR